MRDNCFGFCNKQQSRRSPFHLAEALSLPRSPSVMFGWTSCTEKVVDSGRGHRRRQLLWGCICWRNYVILPTSSLVRSLVKISLSFSMALPDIRWDSESPEVTQLVSDSWKVMNQTPAGLLFTSERLDWERCQRSKLNGSRWEGHYDKQQPVGLVQAEFVIFGLEGWGFNPQFLQVYVPRYPCASCWTLFSSLGL